MQSLKILLVEDEQAIADTLLYALGSEGFGVHHVVLGSQALAAQRHKSFDLIVLDIGLPDVTGFEVLKQLRAEPNGANVPVIFLTARADEIDKVVGLELGADDYVTKPFSPREVVARVKAILRRGSRGPSLVHALTTNENLNPSPTHKVSPGWQHDIDAMRIERGGYALDLTRYEYLLLALLLSTPGKVFTRAQIMDRVWADAIDTADRSVDTHVKTIRAKLRAIGANGDLIQTHRSIGYSLVA